MGNAVGSFFDQMGHVALNDFRLIGDAILSPAKYVLGDDNAFSEVTDAAHNLWRSMGGTVPGDPDPNAPGAQTSTSQGQNISTQAFGAAGAPLTGYSGVSNRAVTAAYSAMPGVTPPSQLMSISDPTTKYMMASIRGTPKKAVIQAMRSNDVQAAPTLRTAMGIGADPGAAIETGSGDPSAAPTATGASGGGSMTSSGITAT